MHVSKLSEIFLCTALKCQKPVKAKDSAFTGFWHFDKITMAVQIAYTHSLTLSTKDLSRLVRNYPKTGTYIGVFFPNHNVRYIAVNDGVDSIDNIQMDITPFRNIINDTLS